MNSNDILQCTRTYVQLCLVTFICPGVLGPLHSTLKMAVKVLKGYIYHVCKILLESFRNFVLFCAKKSCWSFVLWGKPTLLWLGRGVKRILPYIYMLVHGGANNSGTEWTSHIHLVYIGGHATK